MISVGKRPLQGTKLFVRIAISRSRGESITRQAITPAALQPKPMLIVSACLPCAPARRKSQSMLNATRGRYPRFSRIVNSGKKIAIGGSITATTHASPRQTPCQRKPVSQPGLPIASKAAAPASSTAKSATRDRLRRGSWRRRS